MNPIILFLVFGCIALLRAVFLSARVQMRWNATSPQDQMAIVLAILSLPSVLVASLAEAALLLAAVKDGFFFDYRLQSLEALEPLVPGSGVFITTFLWITLAVIWIIGTSIYMNSYPRSSWNFPALICGACSQLAAMVAVAVYFAA